MRRALAVLLTACVAALPATSALAAPDIQRVPAPGHISVERPYKMQTFDALQSQPAPTEEMRRQRDSKLYANLEQKLNAAGDQDAFDVIVTLRRSPTPFTLARLMTHGGKFRVSERWDDAIKGISARLTRAQIIALQQLPEVVSIEYDAPVQVSLDTATYWSGAATVRDEHAITGDLDGFPSIHTAQDVVVAVLDSGIDNGHIDLLGGKVLAFRDVVGGRTVPYDDNGHGTFVAGVISGAGRAQAEMKGVAPGASLVVVKVVNAAGAGTMSQVISGIDWVIRHKDVYNIRVLNLSLSTAIPSDGTDALSQAVDRAVRSGITAVVAAGNNGPFTHSIGAPGAARRAITVGAMAEPGAGGWYLAEFSARGPTLAGVNKPDVVAPGVMVWAPAAGERRGYTMMDGTSVAAAFVSGAIALLLSADPSLSDGDIKQVLQETVRDWGPEGADPEYGWGRIDAYAAVAAVAALTSPGIDRPAHFAAVDQLAMTDDSHWYQLKVTDLDVPVAATLIMPDWDTFGVDFDLYLYDPNGELVDWSFNLLRQENISFWPHMEGDYLLEVHSFYGNGAYFLDVSWE